MIEKIGHIKNPLTVIAIFAGIAEISGTVVLPFVALEVQKIYIWFLMLFPSFLVAVFFYTLHRAPASLYSPSDYQNEDNFVKSVRKTTAEELATKLQLEVKEVESDIKKEQPENPEAPSSEQQVNKENQNLKTDQTNTQGQDESEQSVARATPSVKNSDAANSDSQIRAESGDEFLREHIDRRTRVLTDVAAAEKLAVTRLSRNLGIVFQSDVHFALDAENNRIFNAFANVDRTVHFVEVKYFATSFIDVSRFNDAIDFAHKAVSHFKKGDREVILHLFMVTEADNVLIRQAVNKLISHARMLRVPIRVYTAQMSDLANEYQYG